MSENFSAEERSLLRGWNTQAEKSEKPDSMRGWYPVVVRKQKLWWRFFGEKRFSEPFFHDTVSNLDREKRMCRQTPFEALDKFNEVLAPDAFIFHLSRCGSTLLTQMLATLPSSVVMSEPPVVDSFLSLHHAFPRQSGAEMALRKIIAALGQKRFGEERHFFIKLASWHIDSLPLFRQAFPDTPFIFLYRTPNEVLRSHQRQRGPQMVQGLVDSALLQLDPRPLAPGDLDGYCIKVLSHFLDSACRHSKELILLNYTQLPQIIWSNFLGFFSISPTPSELEAMQARSGLHSKHGMQFEGDPPPTVHIDDERCAELYPYYEKLERLRQEQALFRS